MAAKSPNDTQVHDNIGTIRMKLDNTIAAVVTGGASGLGEGTARAIAATGAKVALFDLNAERGEEIAKEIGGVFCQVDVTDDASVAAAFEKARAVHGQERLTVNCAGIATGQKTVSRKKDTGEIKAHDMAQFERTVRVNLFGTFRVLSQSAAGMVTLEPMADGERGLIVNTASVAAQDGQIGQAAYSASKGGVYAMTLPIARDLAQEGVRCTTILPGIMWTPMMAGMDQKIQDALAAAIPFPSRLGTPADYASLVLELARNVYINGECIRLDGAIRLAPR
jgi:NAD(P)-dependent dehydrogenase (short-subunit alcohol dehydrogenase family)